MDRACGPLELIRAIAALIVSLGLVAADATASDFVAFESDPVRPLALSPDGEHLYVAHTPDGRLEVFALDRGALDPVASVPVGLEPVSVAAHPTRDEVWVVNHLSDSVSIVDVASHPPRVRQTLLVGDEPRDVVFAGPDRNRAFVTTAHRGAHAPDPRGAYDEPGQGRADVWVFDVGPEATLRTIVTLFGDRPRPLAVSPDGGVVYAGVYRSGNRTTTIPGSLTCAGHPDGGTCEVAGHVVPGGHPLPQDNADGVPARDHDLIVQYVPELGEWRDELGRDWSEVVEFDLPDLDVFAIDAMADIPEEIEAWSGVGTILFGMAVHPLSGDVFVSNTQARNEVRFEGFGDHASLFKPPGEPASVRGHLHEARITVIDDRGVHPRHLNKHIDYDDPTPPAEVGERSLATPTRMVITQDGRTLYVAAFGSAKIGVFDTEALAQDTFEPDAATQISLSGGGPVGLALDEPRRRLYVLTRFDQTLSAIDLETGIEVQRAPLYNPEPPSIVAGRPFLYGARLTSSNGEASCAACHVFGDMDDLAWDLGDPDAAVVPNPAVPLFPSVFNQFPSTRMFHPMKGPMLTQSLRGLRNHGPLHWRGDRNGVFADSPSELKDVTAAFMQFNGAFGSLLGRVEGPLPEGDMRAFADFALQLTYPPNPIRRLDGSLRDDEAAGLDIFLNRNGTFLAKAPCAGCHVLDREAGHFGTGGDRGGATPFKIPHLRNLYQRVGMFGAPELPLMREQSQGFMGPQIRGFGFTHSGVLDTVRRQIGSPAFQLTADERREIEASMMAFDTELAPIVGQQVSLSTRSDAADYAQLALLVRGAQAPFFWPSESEGTECELIARTVGVGGAQAWLLRGGVYEPADVEGGPIPADALHAWAARRHTATTFTCAPPGTGLRSALDRDRDGALDGDERRAGTDPADPTSFAGACRDGVDNDADGHADFPADPGCASADSIDESPACSNGLDDDGDGRIDHPDDPSCDSPAGTRETVARDVRLVVEPRWRAGSGWSRWWRGHERRSWRVSLSLDPATGATVEDIDGATLRAGTAAETVLPAAPGTLPGNPIGAGRLTDRNRDGAPELELRVDVRDHAIGPDGLPTSLCIVGLIEDDPFRACREREQGGPRCGLGFELAILVPLVPWARARRRCLRAAARTASHGKPVAINGSLCCVGIQAGHVMN